MKKFIIKSALFTLPFFFSFIVTTLLYIGDESADLLRIGYIPNIYKNYRNVFTTHKDERFIKLSAAKKNKYKIMTIGDSFSEQGANGYKNFLAADYSLLHIDRYISDNPVQTLVNLCNGDFFEHYNVEYVILQRVERHLIDSINNIDMNGKITVREIDSLISRHKTDRKPYKYNFFSRTTILFPYHLPKYFFAKNYLSNKQVYNYDLTSESLFSNHSDKLLFYHTDVINTPQINNIENCEKLNKVLNDISRMLSKRNIKLIFLPSTDKYDLYYEFIVDKKGLPKPIFFDNFKSLKKEYYYIDSKSILSDYLNKKQDLFYYDDTHWSPIATKIIADNIKLHINKN